jgi:hypothetical protein
MLFVPGRRREGDVVGAPLPKVLPKLRGLVAGLADARVEVGLSSSFGHELLKAYFFQTVGIHHARCSTHLDLLIAFRSISLAVAEAIPVRTERGSDSVSARRALGGLGGPAPAGLYPSTLRNREWNTFGG